MNITSFPSSSPTPVSLHPSPRSSSSSRSLGTRPGTKKYFPLPPIKTTEQRKEHNVMDAKITVLNQQITTLQHCVRALSNSFHKSKLHSSSEIAYPQNMSRQKHTKLQDIQKQLYCTLSRLKRLTNPCTP